MYLFKASTKMLRKVKSSQVANPRNAFCIEQRASSKAKRNACACLWIIFCCCTWEERINIWKRLASKRFYMLLFVLLGATDDRLKPEEQQKITQKYAHAFLLALLLALCSMQNALRGLATWLDFTMKKNSTLILSTKYARVNRPHIQWIIQGEC